MVIAIKLIIISFKSALTFSEKSLLLPSYGKTPIIKQIFLPNLIDTYCGSLGAVLTRPNNVNFFGLAYNLTNL